MAYRIEWLNRFSRQTVQGSFHAWIYGEVGENEGDFFCWDLFDANAELVIASAITSQVKIKT